MVWRVIRLTALCSHSTKSIFDFFREEIQSGKWKAAETNPRVFDGKSGYSCWDYRKKFYQMNVIEFEILIKHVRISNDCSAIVMLSVNLVWIEYTTHNIADTWVPLKFSHDFRWRFVYDTYLNPISNKDAEFLLLILFKNYNSLKLKFVLFHWHV